MRIAARAAIVAFLVGCGPLTAAAARGVESGPQGVVRQFCQADALGLRVSVPGWAVLAPLVSWSFEPAWDHVVLITGYSVDSPRPSNEGTLAIDVHYTIVGHLSALGIDTETQVETVTFEVSAPDDSGWRIIGPPPPPHIFGNRVEVDQMRQSLARGATNFLADSVFVTEMFRTAGWSVEYKRAADLLDHTAYRPVDAPKAGDLVVYLRNGAPYHVGLLEAENRVVSSTLNAGVVRTATDAFPGEVLYLRLVQPDATVADGAPVSPDVYTQAAPPIPPVGIPRMSPAVARTPRATPASRPVRATPPVLHQRKRKPQRLRRHPAQPSASKHVKRKAAPQKRPPPTPVATVGRP